MQLDLSFTIANLVIYVVVKDTFWCNDVDKLWLKSWAFRWQSKSSWHVLMVKKKSDFFRFFFTLKTKFKSPDYDWGVDCGNWKYWLFKLCDWNPIATFQPSRFFFFFFFFFSFLDQIQIVGSNNLDFYYLATIIVNHHFTPT